MNREPPDHAASSARRLLAWLLAAVTVASCATTSTTATASPRRRARPPARAVRERPTEARAVPEPRLVSSVTEAPREPPGEGRFRLHLIDVGSGLSVLVQGHDFVLLFDGGSKDASECGAPTRTDDETRVLSYLFAVLGPSGGCMPEGDGWTDVPAARTRIDHVVLSHPHSDHASMLDEVLRCYDVSHLWDTGLANDADFYWAYLEAVADAPGLAWHTVRALPSTRVVSAGDGVFTFPESLAHHTFARGELVTLGAGATARVVHADPTPDLRHENDASIVLRLDLGETSVLLAGDIEAGPRDGFDGPPTGAERAMLEHDPEWLDVDILQVAHHGSRTSSRRAFLERVSPEVALLSAGPTRYASVVLPDPEVVEALERVGARVYRTDAHDIGRDCSVPGVSDRVGRDRGPGGCDNYVFDLP